TGAGDRINQSFLHRSPRDVNDCDVDGMAAGDVDGASAGITAGGAIGVVDGPDAIRNVEIEFPIGAGAETANPEAAAIAAQKGGSAFLQVERNPISVVTGRAADVLVSESRGKAINKNQVIIPSGDALAAVAVGAVQDVPGDVGRGKARLIDSPIGAIVEETDPRLRHTSPCGQNKQRHQTKQTVWLARTSQIHRVIH